MDVVVIGGGVIGLLSALRLAQRGHQVRIVERGEPGREASWAAAGILGAQAEAEAKGPFLELCLRSRELYPALAAELGDIGFSRCGALRLAFTEEEAEQIREQQAWQSAAGLRAELVGHPGARLALWQPDDGVVDNRKLTLALRSALGRARVPLLRARAARLRFGRDALEAVETEREILPTRRAVVAAGAWSAEVAGSGIAADALVPVRGQMIAYTLPLRPASSSGAAGMRCLARAGSWSARLWSTRGSTGAPPPRAWPGCGRSPPVSCPSSPRCSPPSTGLASDRDPATACRSSAGPSPAWWSPPATTATASCSPPLPPSWSSSWSRAPLPTCAPSPPDASRGPRSLRARSLLKYTSPAKGAAHGREARRAPRPRPALVCREGADRIEGPLSRPLRPLACPTPTGSGPSRPSASTGSSGGTRSRAGTSRRPRSSGSSAARPTCPTTASTGTWRARARTRRR